MQPMSTINFQITEFLIFIGDYYESWSEHGLVCSLMCGQRKQLCAVDIYTDRDLLSLLCGI